MKKFWFLCSVITMMSSSFLVSCKEDEKEDEPAPVFVSEENMSVKVNGTYAYFETMMGASTNIMHSINGVNNTIQVAVELPVNPTVGTHQIDSTSFGDYGIVYYPEKSNFMTSKKMKTGSVTITEYNASTGVIKGTFYGATTISPIYTLTEGTFIYDLN